MSLALLVVGLECVNVLNLVVGSFASNSFMSLACWVVLLELANVPRISGRVAKRDTFLWSVGFLLYSLLY
jgi:hypothetical protein